MEFLYIEERKTEMINKRIKFWSAYLFSVLVLCLILFINPVGKNKESKDIQLYDIKEISINGKVLSEQYHQYLYPLKEMKVVSYDKKYNDLLELTDVQADYIEIKYFHSPSIIVFTGLTKENGSKVFLRIKGSDTVYEVTGEISKIIDEKPDSSKEYSLFDAVHLTSVIAIKIVNDEANLFLTEDSNNRWIDQISGLALNRLKVQNVISKILNLRVLENSDDVPDFFETDTIQIETQEGQIFRFFFKSTEEDYIYISNDSIDYKILREKVDFLKLTIEDLQ